MSRRTGKTALALLVVCAAGLSLCGATDGERPEVPGAAPDDATFQQRLDTGRHLVEAGKSSEAERLARELLAWAEAAHGAESLQVGEVLDLLVEGLGRWGRFREAEARDLAGRALKIKEQALGPEHRGVLSSLYSFSDLLRDAGENAAARPLLERALAIEEKVGGPGQPGTHDALRRLAEVLVRLGAFQEARPLAARALSISETRNGRDDPRITGDLNGLGGILAEMGSYAEARPLLERALAIAEKHPGPADRGLHEGLVNLGALLLRAGAYVESRALTERALALSESRLGPEHAGVAADLMNVASLCYHMGDASEATRLLTRAQVLWERQVGKDHEVVAAVLANLGEIERLEGAGARGRAHFERAAAILEERFGPEHPLVATGLSDLGSLMSDIGSFVEAEPLLTRAVALAESGCGPDHLSIGDHLERLAGLYAAMGRFAEARALLERTLHIRRTGLGPDHYTVAITLHRLALARAALGDRKKAFTEALEAEAIVREHLAVTAAGAAEGVALRHAATGARGLDVALSLLIGEDMGDAPLKAGRVFDAAIRSRGVVTGVLARRHRSPGPAGDPAGAGLAAAYAALTARVANLAVLGPDEVSADFYRAIADEARLERRRAESQLAAASSEFRGARERRASGLSEVAGALPKDAALVAFVRYRRHDVSKRAPGGANAVAPAGEPRRESGDSAGTPSYAAFVLRAGAASPALVPLGAAEEIDPIVARATEQMVRGDPAADRAAAGAEQAYRAAGLAVRRMVWDKVAERLGGARRVFVVPVGSLNRVSLAALPEGDDGYLIETGPLIHYLAAERDLVPSSGPAADGQGLLVVGSPAFDASAAGQRRPGTAAAAAFHGDRPACVDFRTTRFESLPEGGREVKAVVAAWKKFAGRRDGAVDTEGKGTKSKPGVPVDLSGGSADEASLKAAARGLRVLHLSTRGLFLAGSCSAAPGPAGAGRGSPADAAGLPPPAARESPLRLAGLALAGANHAASAGAGEEDGILTAEEIAALDLGGVEWVVLSSDPPAAVAGGEDVDALRRAFQVAGARTVIMGLWPVDDAVARDYMKWLYERRLGENLPTAEAVREAALAVLRERRAKGDSTHPYAWGGYVAAGDWR